MCGRLRARFTPRTKPASQCRREGHARLDLRAGSDAGRTTDDGVPNLRWASAGADSRIPDSASAARLDPARPADAMVERGTVWQSQWRHPAALEIGSEHAHPEALLLLGPISLVARKRVVAGQPWAADRRSAKLFECQTQANRRPGGGSATVTSFPGADCACPARDGADAGARHAPASAVTPASLGSGPSATPAPKSQ